MEGTKLNEGIIVDKTFMYSRIEYRIIYINNQKGRINVELVDPTTARFPQQGQKIRIENIEFTVIYVNPGKNRISLE